MESKASSTNTTDVAEITTFEFNNSQRVLSNNGNMLRPTPPTNDKLWLNLSSALENLNSQKQILCQLK